MKIAFVLGSLSMGGGNYVVCQHALFAAGRGHDVSIVVMDRFSVADAQWHPGFASLKLLHIDEAGAEHYDIAVATYWRTALELHKLQARQYAYFVQSIESRFFDETQIERRALVDRTYELRLPGITEATWIRDHLAQNYGSRYHLVHNGIRKDLYTADGSRHAPRDPRRLRVLVEGGFSAPFKNVARTVSTARRARPHEIWLLTSTSMRWYPGVDRLFSRVPVTEVAAVYRSCDVIVKLSLVEGMFGPPLEMFHCGGTAVVYDVSGHDEYIVHGQNALVAKMHDESTVVEYLRELRDSPELLARLKQGAAETAAAWPDWDESSGMFLQRLEEVYASEPVARDRLVQATRQIEQDFAHVLQPARRAPPQQAGALSARLQAMRDSVRTCKEWIGYVREGYR